MPRADRYMAGLCPQNANKTAVRAKVLTQLEAAILSKALSADAADLYYSGWVSFLDGLNGIGAGFYTWATTKLYYSVFYTFRAYLALHDTCAFHVSRPHYIVLAQPGQVPVSCAESGTHKTVLRTFQKQHPNHALMSQQIGLKDAADWLMDNRDSANYGNAKFSEPDTRTELQFIVDTGIRKTLTAYLADKASLYAFDPDHAMVAYPLKALQLIGDSFLTGGDTVHLALNEQQFLKSHAKDRSGPLSMLIAEMKRLALVS